MPVGLISRRKVDEADAIGVYIGDTLIGYITPETYEELEEPEYKRATFDVPENYGE